MDGLLSVGIAPTERFGVWPQLDIGALVSSTLTIALLVGLDVTAWKNPFSHSVMLPAVCIDEILALRSHA